MDATELSKATKIVESIKQKTETVEENKVVDIKNEGTFNKEIKTIETLAESTKANLGVFSAPVPVVKTIPIINIPMLLKNRLAYDKIMTTQFNKVCTY